MQNYSSYLIRHWLIGNDSDERSQVFDIEHVQSGRRTRVSRLDEAQLWCESVSTQYGLTKPEHLKDGNLPNSLGAKR